MRFQAIDWCDFDRDYRYTVYLFGRTLKAESVCVKINGWKPSFYVKVQDKDDAKRIISIIGAEYDRNHKFRLQMDARICNGGDMYGFNNNEQFTFLELQFHSKYTANQCMYIAKKLGKVYNGNFDTCLKLINDNLWKTTGWYELKGKLKALEATEHWCNIGYEIDYTQLICDPKPSTENAPFLQASFDIETYSPTEHFSDPKKKDCPVICISTMYQYLGKDDFHRRTLHTLGPCDPIEGIEVYEYENEAEMLIGWAKSIQKNDPDTIYSYNGDKFDFNYIYERCKLFFCDLDYLDILSRITGRTSVHTEEKFSSSAYGTNIYYRTKIPGRLGLDILVFVQREFKLRSYKLKSVSEEFLKGETKVDLPYKEMFRLYKESLETKTGHQMKTIGIYCDQDTALCQHLANRFLLLPSQIEMANVCHVPVSFLLSKGQSIKCFSQLYRMCRQKNLLIPDMEKEDLGSFQGATVLVAKKGFYEDYVATLDFASLYPSIIRAFKLDYTTIVLDSKYDNLPGVEYEDIEWEETIDDTAFTMSPCQIPIKSGAKKGEFCGRQGVNGICKTHGGIDAPQTTKKNKYRFVQNREPLLPILLRDLYQWRKAVKKEMAQATGTLRQLLDKRQNSIKVSMNSFYGFLSAPKLPCQAIAACTTAKGRQMIKRCVKFAEDEFPSIIRDEKLVNYPLTLNVIYGDSVTARMPVLFKTPEGNTFIEAIGNVQPVAWESYSLFKGLDFISSRSDKSCGTLNGYRVWSDFGWTPVKRIIRHRCMKRIYGIWTATSYVEVTEDHSLLDLYGDCVKPEELVLNSTVLLHHEEFKPYEQYPMDFNSLNEPKVKCNDLLMAAKMHRHYRQEGYHIGLSAADGGFDLVVKTEAIKNPYTVRKVEFLGYTDDYVYDLETDCGQFQAGVGSMIVKNTDSIFIHFKTPGVSPTIHEDIHRLSEKCADLITTRVFNRDPINLEFEKSYSPLLLFEKKRYMGRKYEDLTKPPVFDYKGVQNKRTDGSKLLVRVYNELMRIVLSGEGKEKAFAFVENVVKDLFQGKVHIDELVISKSLKPSSEYKILPAHVILAERIKQRDPSQAYTSGEKLPYVFIKNPKAKIQADQVETPEYVIEHKLPIDYAYYFERQLYNPIIDFFEIIDSDKIHSIMEKARLTYIKKQSTLQSYFTKNTNN